MLIASVWVASAGLAALVLGMVGSYRGWLAFVMSVPAVAASMVALRRAPATHPEFRWGPALAALMIVFAVTSFWSWRPSEHVLVNRDPGSYVTTALSLERTGALWIDQSDGPFAISQAEPEAATYLTGMGRYEFQFNHLLPAILAVAHSIGGMPLLLRVPALLTGLGLLATYVVCSRVTRRPWLSLAAPAVLGVSLPMLYIARDAFSETATYALLWSGVLAVAITARTRSRGVAALAGLLLASTTAARVDALLVLVPLAGLAGACALGAGEGMAERRRLVLAGFLGALVPAVIGLIDLEWFSGGYVSLLRSETLLLRAGLVVAVVLGGVVAVVVRRTAHFDERIRWGLGAIGTTAVCLALLFFWFVRPALFPTHGAEGKALTGYQVAEGLTADPGRSHFEASFQWMVWYLGPIAVVLAVAGLCVGVFRLLSGRSAPILSVVTLIGILGLFYWWDPSIFADQPWASRRFAPAIYPAMVVLAVFLLACISAALDRTDRIYRRLGSALVVLGMVLGAGATTWPVRWGRTQVGYPAALESVCDVVGPDAAVVTLESWRPRRLAPALRAWCGVPVVALDGPSEQTLSGLAARWDDLHTSMWIVTADPDLLDRTQLSGAFTSSIGPGQQAIDRTLTKPPSTYRDPEPLRLWVVPVGPSREGS